LRPTKHIETIAAPRSQERTLDILIGAVRGGMTVQEARIGTSLAQFELLPAKLKERALAAAREKLDRMPVEQREAVRRHLRERNEREREQLEAMSDGEREQWVRSVWRPSQGHPAALM